ncbi:MAG: hypothetical protein K6U04_13325 [Armatimonadetes bacterium]|nr:hypothetical protein [Armatimonadota bacterium]
MLITIGGAVWVYYVLTVQKGLSETFGMAAGVVVAIVLAAFFTKLKRREERERSERERKGERRKNKKTR